MTRQLTLFLVCAFEVALILFVAAWTAWAEEKYTCYLDKFMEVANDGRFFGPEATKVKLDIDIKDKKVFFKMDKVKGELTLIEKLGAAQFAAKGGIAAMDTLHVWKQGSSDKYDVQYSTNHARSITIRTGACLRY
jgi:hypothetical protein